MKLNDYQKKAKRTIPFHKERTLRIAEFSLGLCEEAGESAGVLKKVVFHNHPLTTEKRARLVGELGDTLWHLAALATEFNITLEEVADYNIFKLQGRYPEGFSDERSINRVEVE